MKKIYKRPSIVTINISTEENLLTSSGDCKSYPIDPKNQCGSGEQLSRRDGDSYWDWVD